MTTTLCSPLSDEPPEQDHGAHTRSSNTQSSNAQSSNAQSSNAQSSNAQSSNAQSSHGPESSRRRTFAIISHPDAGKTTLTEKLLLYSGMIRTAGMVRGRKGRKQARSDWMSMEVDRGISITASAMQFNYKGKVVNVLDTPGHQDFSEDTYRTLTAADSAIMVIDAAKGVEAQTRKLFAVCRMHNIPILTFINKMDVPGKDALDLLHELEEVLEIGSCPINWPLGYGKEFVGTAEVESIASICRALKDTKTEDGSSDTGQVPTVAVFTRGVGGGAEKAESALLKIDSPDLRKVTSEATLSQLKYELDLIREAGNRFDLDKFRSGQLTPVFFGSALTNFGVEPFFDAFVELAPEPQPRTVLSNAGEKLLIDPKSDLFSAFVFKIQANMDPRHRDSMAFLRVCSGRFERDITVKHERLGKSVRLSRAHSMFGGERETVEYAYPGDIVGVVNPGLFAIGDTVSHSGGIHFPPMPQFPPEVVATLRTKDISKRKHFDKGVRQLASEGAVQLLWPWKHPDGEPYIAAVGRLQFEVLQHRLENEYNVVTLLEILPYECGAWLVGDVSTFTIPFSAALMRDADGRAVVLFRNDWEKKYAEGQHPDHRLLDYGGMASPG